MIDASGHQGDSMTQMAQNLQILAPNFFIFLFRPFFLPQHIDKYEEHPTGNKRLNSHTKMMSHQ